MNFSPILREIRSDSSLNPYWQDVWQFIEYLRTTERSSFQTYGVVNDGETWNPIQKEIEYVHRFTPTYRKSIVKKFYQLEDWHNENPTPITLLSLTTYQEGSYSRSVKEKDVTIPESFELLKTSWYYLSKAIRYYLPNVPWVWIMEPHKTGYPHYHVVLFSDVDRGTQAALKHLWSTKYQAGSYQYGADFAVSKPEQSIKSIRNYLMKYVAKSFVSTGSKFGEEDTWTAGQLVFYALVRKNKWRLFDASRDLRNVMACKDVPDERIVWYATQLLLPETEPYTVWCRKGAEEMLESVMPFRGSENP